MCNALTNSGKTICSMYNFNSLKFTISSNKKVVIVYSLIHQNSSYYVPRITLDARNYWELLQSHEVTKQRKREKQKNIYISNFE